MVNPKLYIGIYRYRNISFHWSNRYNPWYRIDSLATTTKGLIVELAYPQFPCTKCLRLYKGNGSIYHLLPKYKKNKRYDRIFCTFQLNLIKMQFNFFLKSKNSLMIHFSLNFNFLGIYLSLDQINLFFLQKDQKGFYNFKL